MTVASLTSLTVYLVPLLALLMSFDAVAGEVERGTLPLLPHLPRRAGGDPLGKFLRISPSSPSRSRWASSLPPPLPFAPIQPPSKACFRALAAWVESLHLARSHLPRRGLRAVVAGATTLGRGGSGDGALARRGRADDLGLLSAVVADGDGWFTTTASLRAARQPGRCLPPLQPRRLQATLAAAGVSGRRTPSRSGNLRPRSCSGPSWRLRSRPQPSER